MADVRMRPADDDDAARLWRWRNDDATRRWSFDPEPVPWSTHVEWLAASIERHDRHVLVAEVAGAPVGTVRFDDRGGGAWEIAVTLDPGYRGRGLAAPVLRAGADWLAAREEVTAIVARVKATNEASRQAFAGAGFAPRGEGTDIVELILPVS